MYSKQLTCGLKQLNVLSISSKVGKKSGICSSQQKTVSRKSFKSVSDGKEGRTSGCESDWEKKVKAINRCNILKSNVFASCHRRVSLAPYFKSCAEEVCSCQEGDNNCHCNALDSYVIQCQLSGIKLSRDWESLSSCDTSNTTSIEKAGKTACPKGSIYTPCVNPCPRTCNNMTGVQNNDCNKSKCEAGCDCPPGLVWNINRCVLPRNCKVSSQIANRSWHKLLGRTPQIV